MLAPRFIRTSTRTASIWTCVWCQSTRAFRTSPLYGARPDEAPSVGRKERATQGTISDKTRGPGLDVDKKAIWPIALLESAKASGALQIRAGDAVSFLENYIRLASTNVERLQNLCQDHQVEPLTMTILAQILDRTSNINLKDISRSLFFSASALNEPIATLKIVSEAFQNGTLAMSELAKPLQRLTMLAKMDNNAPAVMLLAQILESQGKVDKALTYYEQITNNEGKNRAAAEVDGTVAQAWLALGRIKASNEDFAGAEAALKKAALEYDEPTAYFYLARFCDPKSGDYLLYNLKAASSGVREAAHNLGDFYLRQSKRVQQTSSAVDTTVEDGKDATSESSESEALRPDPPTDLSQVSPARTPQGINSQEKRALAREWFNVAAYAGFAPSQVNLALLLRADGSFDEGMTWLKRAEKHADFGAEVDRLKESWWKKDVNLT